MQKIMSGGVVANFQGRRDCDDSDSFEDRQTSCTASSRSCCSTDGSFNLKGRYAMES